MILGWNWSCAFGDLGGATNIGKDWDVAILESNRVDICDCE